ncbi:MAG: LIC12192 family sporadic carbohydrate cluster protein [Thalassobaculaceae bacterium]
MAVDKGYIGYNGARHLATGRAPQHIQNLVIRDYCGRHGLPFKLSASEYAMPHCYMMLDKLVEEIGQHDGIVMYSMFMLPARTARRRALYRRILGAGASLHAAVEDLALATETDLARWEDILRVQALVAATAPPVFEE